MDQNILSKVLKLYITLQNGTKVTKEFINVDKNGIENDKHYKTNINRSILLTATSSYELAKKNNIQLHNGDLGENILVDFDIFSSKIGTQYKIGTAILQITQEGTLCKGLSKINTQLPKLLKTKRGIFAKVIKSGIIKPQDDVIKLQ